MPASTAGLDKTLAALPQRYAGPGGAVAVLKDGEVLARHSWGWADAERRIPFTPQTISLICSISKQFTCALMLDQFPDPTVLNGDLHRRLPLLEDEKPGILDLAHNQSGLRDYWAVAMLYGAPIEGLFTGEDADRIIRRTRSLHFSPGTRYSYCNQNSGSCRTLSRSARARISPACCVVASSIGPACPMPCSMPIRPGWPAAPWATKAASPKGSARR